MSSFFPVKWWYVGSNMMLNRCRRPCWFYSWCRGQLHNFIQRWHLSRLRWGSGKGKKIHPVSLPLIGAKWSALSLPSAAMSDPSCPWSKGPRSRRQSSGGGSSHTAPHGPTWTFTAVHLIHLIISPSVCPRVSPLYNTSPEINSLSVLTYFTTLHSMCTTMKHPTSLTNHHSLSSVLC